MVFDKTTFESVQARLGGMFNEVGDAANTSKWVCYYQRHTSMPWVIWLVGGEINGNRVGWVPQAIAALGMPSGSRPDGLYYQSRAHILPSQYAPAALYHDQYGRRLVTE